ncbi:MAG: damage-inducible protein CinA [SAR86 cluster bacterium]|uniref:CinA-like protein n=1 Tax=SAR86 cluster bacterium TaxID=2030880 RepID=A0A2A5CHS6_9GAMM|nr:MAG: damage-inducible protein CinA [SAR86 cluster bacterium]
MKLEMICTGEEVLSGQIVDTNAAWFANTMMNQGIELQRKTTVGDRLDDLANTFIERSQHADVILVNGGLGPTTDDLSAEALALALGEELVEDKDWRLYLIELFKKIDRKLPANMLKQCLIPASAIRIDNAEGTAPGFRAKLNNAWLFFTPGVPIEFKAMVKQQFIPFIETTYQPAQATLLHKLLTLGHGESFLADKLDVMEIPAGITLGYRPSAPHVEVKLFARGDAAIKQLPAFIEKVKDTLGTAVVTENCPSIAQAVHELLLNKKRSLSIAESCTGGMLTNQLIEFAGSSSYLHQGLVTYSNQAKQNILGLNAETIEQYGAVSIETAKAMAENVRALGDSDYALATTGIAGPDGGSEEKPVGTVCIALVSRRGCWVQTVQLKNRSRTIVRTMSCAIALDMLRRSVLAEDEVQAVIVPYSFIPCSDSKIVMY